ncbi:hypothetical protein CN680_22570 [Bacillus pseudomycoides]|uniref:hypothetical protein n=1 Tax=Bacillus pseudomycoides TaxID=64104 RepID=UPI000BED91CC|nr:hypothetical protein [Bacillus pseudomycoides]PED69097.1 hypothetical protein CON97_27245 [Bacillus pseudomycoides]PEI34056.1 hypothetical protein CN620_26715 [Bacillus pseudomycoides]PEJ71718.1 hypothetical protein CN680_22570 [Bacillus pseudomycoides]PEM09790.1 hypothetical protein CN628_23280 [Bacillus pseudomycoides]PEO98861.1 hypothetical protein CN550_13385 [Bacillus pseudomycoides]
MKRINMKKIIPAAFVLSTALFVAPGFSSAAIDTSTNVGNLPVVISSQEGKAPMTAAQVKQNGMALPYIPTGPYEEFPNEWHVSTNDGALIDYVYVDVVAKENGTSINNVIRYKDYRILKADGTWLQDGESYSKTANKGQVLYSIAIPKTNPALSDTKLKKNVSWKLIDSNIVDKNSGYHWSKAVTSGISHNVTVGLSYTIGMEVGLEGIAKVNQSLTASFGYGVTLNSESTVTKTFDFNPKPDYAYDQYRTALYQQVANYSVAPGAGLQKWISNWENNDPTVKVLKLLGKPAPFEYKVKESVDYPVDILVALTSK